MRGEGKRRGEERGEGRGKGEGVGKGKGAGEGHGSWAWLSRRRDDPLLTSDARAALEGGLPGAEAREASGRGSAFVSRKFLFV